MMKISQWLTVILAVVAILLSVGTWWLVHQNQKAQADETTSEVRNDSISKCRRTYQNIKTTDSDQYYQKVSDCISATATEAVQEVRTQ